MNAYFTEFLARDRAAQMVIAAENARLLVHVPESPPLGPRPGSRFAAWARTIVHIVRPVRPVRSLSMQSTD